MSKNRTLTAAMVSGRVLARWSAKTRVDSAEHHAGFLVWAGTLNPKTGAGSFWTGPDTGDVYPAHRVAYALEHGEAPAGRNVKQTCEIHSCVDHRHLMLAVTDETPKRHRAHDAIVAAVTEGDHVEAVEALSVSPGAYDPAEALVDFFNEDEG